MKLFILLIYGLQGYVSIEETTLLPQSGDSSRPLPDFKELVSRLVGCSRIQTSYLQPSISGSRSLITSNEIPTTREENESAMDTSSYVCQPGPSRAPQAQSHQEVSSESVDRNKEQNHGERSSLQQKLSSDFSQEISKYISTRHSLIRSRDRPLTCRLCDKSLSSTKHLKKHFTESHSDSRPFSCQICGKSFPTRECLKRHSTSHSDVRPFPCKICGWRFKRKDHLITHSRTCSYGRHFPRGRSGTTLRTRIHLRSRMKEQARVDERSLVSERCDESFGYDPRSERRLHEMQTRNEPQSQLFSCTLCASSFDREDGLSNHMSIHGQSHASQEPEMDVESTEPHQRMMLDQLSQSGLGSSGECSYSDRPMDGALNLQELVYEARTGSVMTTDEIMRLALEVVHSHSCYEYHTLLRTHTQQSGSSTERPRRSSPKPRG